MEKLLVVVRSVDHGFCYIHKYLLFHMSFAVFIRNKP